MANKNGKFLKELKSWTKPTRGIQFTPFKAAYSLAKTAFRHPYLSIAATLAVKGDRKPGKYAKGLKFGQGPLAGKKWASGGKWFL